jgi:hypothetical protein
MPLDYDIPEQITETIEKIELASIGMDYEQSSIYCVYRKGKTVTGSFIQVGDIEQVSISTGAGVDAFFQRVKANVQGGDTPQKAFEKAGLEEIKNQLGITGVIS